VVPKGVAGGNFNFLLNFTKNIWNITRKELAYFGVKITKILMANAIDQDQEGSRRNFTYNYEYKL